MESEIKKKPEMGLFLRQGRALRIAFVCLFIAAILGLAVYYVTVSTFVNYYQPLLTDETQVYAVWQPGDNFYAADEAVLLANFLGQDSDQIQSSLDAMLAVQPSLIGLSEAGGKSLWFYQNPQVQTSVDGFTEQDVAGQSLFVSQDQVPATQSTLTQRLVKRRFKELSEHGQNIGTYFVRATGRQPDIFAVRYRAANQQRLEIGTEQTNFFAELLDTPEKKGSASFHLDQGMEQIASILPIPSQVSSSSFIQHLWPGEWTITQGTAEQAFVDPYQNQLAWEWDGPQDRGNELSAAILTDLTALFPTSEPYKLPDGDTVNEIVRKPDLFTSGENPANTLTYPNGQIQMQSDQSQTAIIRGDRTTDQISNPCTLPAATSWGYISHQQDLEQLWKTTFFSFTDDHFIACFAR